MPAALGEARSLMSGGQAIGLVLCTLPTPQDAPFAFTAQLGDDPEWYAAGLYDALHSADAAECEQLFIEEPPAIPQWDAIRDRLQRSAHPG